MNGSVASTHFCAVSTAESNGSDCRAVAAAYDGTGSFCALAPDAAMTLADLVTGLSYVVMIAIAGSLAIMWWMEE